jgi:hypothetical protein
MKNLCIVNIEAKIWMGYVSLDHYHCTNKIGNYQTTSLSDNKTHSSDGCGAGASQGLPLIYLFIHSFKTYRFNLTSGYSLQPVLFTSYVQSKSSNYLQWNIICSEVEKINKFTKLHENWRWNQILNYEKYLKYYMKLTYSGTAWEQHIYLVLKSIPRFNIYHPGIRILNWWALEMVAIF